MPAFLCLYPGSVSERAAFFGRHAPGLRARGFELVLADDWLTERDRAIFDRCVLLPPAAEVAAAAAELERFAREVEVAGVLAQSEAALAPGSWLAARLGLPGVGLDGAYACLSKLASRARLCAAGVPVPPFALATSGADVRAFARDHGFPLVLKGCASSLGRLVTRIDDESAIDGAVARMLAELPRSRDVRRLAEFAALAGLALECDPERAFLVEDFWDGDPLETDGLVCRGAVDTFGVLEQRLTPPPRFYIEGYLFPADRGAAKRARIERISSAAIAASGISTSGFSIELRDRGGDVRVIEINARLGEDDGFPELFRAALGREPMREAIELALGGARMPAPSRAERCWALAYSCAYLTGNVAGVPSQLKLAELTARGLQAGVCAHLGEPWFVAPHPDAFPHVAWVLAQHPTSSRTAFERALAALDELPVAIEPATALAQMQP